MMTEPPAPATESLPPPTISAGEFIAVSLGVKGCSLRLSYPIWMRKIGIEL